MLKSERFSLKCAVPENIHTHPKEGHWKFRGGGSQKPNFFKESMTLNWNVQEGRGFKPKNLPWGCTCMDIFWNHTIKIIIYNHNIIPIWEFDWLT